jgi:hypothetical protein
MFDFDKDEHKAVFGIYKSRGAVEMGVERLKMDGFSASEISVLMPDRAGSDDFAHENSTKAPEGATTGAGTGLVLGGTLGWLAGVGALAIPGVGPLIAAGPIVGLLAGAGAGAAVGGIAGGLVGMGIPEYEAKRYEGFVKDGGILLSVHAGSDEAIKRAKLALEQTGATDISSNDEVKSSSNKFGKKDADQPRTRF